jgi:hypothetical protein
VEEKGEGQFNSSFREGESIYISSNPDVIFEKTVVIPLFEDLGKEAKWGNLPKLQKILAELYKLEISGS